MADINTGSYAAVTSGGGFSPLNCLLLYFNGRQLERSHDCEGHCDLNLDILELFKMFKYGTLTKINIRGRLMSKSNLFCLFFFSHYSFSKFLFPLSQSIFILQG